MSSVPLGENLIPIQRGLTTSSTAIFIPFITQELFQTGAALYYGLNALSNNMILCDRNMIDGQINNTPTVAELEAKVKAGETISLVDLAEAVKADKERGKAAKTEKKLSIRAQLRADKEKTVQKKATKSKNHELEV